ncbi:hypothetical protein B0H14DRAFT_2634796 [Mycena olivaceomarginata]|nr:hypothetical protein B0H14DRAFT_2634796 [Mycena olivaceomarginata]
MPVEYHTKQSGPLEGKGQSMKLSAYPAAKDSRNAQIPDNQDKLIPLICIQWSAGIEPPNNPSQRLPAKVDSKNGLDLSKVVALNKWRETSHRKADYQIQKDVWDSSHGGLSERRIHPSAEKTRSRETQTEQALNERARVVDGGDAEQAGNPGSAELARSVAIQHTQRRTASDLCLREKTVKKTPSRNALPPAYGTHRRNWGGSQHGRATLVCFMAKPLHPWQQKKAHQEIDIIVNAEMLPDFSEMKHRPHGFPLIEEFDVNVKSSSDSERNVHHNEVTELKYSAMAAS